MARANSNEEDSNSDSGSVSSSSNSKGDSCDYGTLPGVWLNRRSPSQMQWQLLGNECQLHDLLTPLSTAIIGPTTTTTTAGGDALASPLVLAKEAVERGILLIGACDNEAGVLLTAQRKITQGQLLLSLCVAYCR